MNSNNLVGVRRYHTVHCNFHVCRVIFFFWCWAIKHRIDDKRNWQKKLQPDWVIIIRFTVDSYVIIQYWAGTKQKNNTSTIISVRQFKLVRHMALLSRKSMRNLQEYLIQPHMRWPLFAFVSCSASNSELMCIGGWKGPEGAGGSIYASCFD